MEQLSANYDGVYIYIEASGQSGHPDKEAILEGTFYLSTEVALSFVYHMYASLDTDLGLRVEISTNFGVIMKYFPNLIIKVINGTLVIQ